VDIGAANDVDTKNFMKSWTLHYQDGTYQIIMPPPLLKEVDGQVVVFAHLVREAHAMLKIRLHEKQVQEGMKIYPFNEADAKIYSALGYYYEAVSRLVNPLIIVPRLTPKSRHEFFICTDPVKHPYEDVMLPGMSGLEQLMGFNYSFGERHEPEHTTGDINLDVLTGVVLSFKKNALPLASMLGVDDLSQMVGHANWLMTPKEERDKGKKATPTKIKAVVDDKEFQRLKPLIMERLEEFGAIVPPGF
jgi:hypothetical protein